MHTPTHSLRDTKAYFAVHVRVCIPPLVQIMVGGLKFFLGGDEDTPNNDDEFSDSEVRVCVCVCVRVSHAYIDSTQREQLQFMLNGNQFV